MLGIQQKYGIKPYNVTVSSFPKVSLIEIAVKSIKRLFFSLLLEFRSSSYEHLLKLSCQLYNNRVHRTTKLTPYACHFSSYCASLAARRMINKYNIHRQESKNIFDQLKHKQLFPGQKVLIKVKPKSFQRLNSVFSPDFMQKPFTIKHVFKNKLPYLYSMVELDKKHRFYSHNLQPLDSQFGKATSSKNKILVKDAELEKRSYLRSGNTPAGKQTIFYRVQENDGENKLITLEQLQNLIKIFGRESIQFDRTFYESEDKQKYIIPTE